MKRTLIALAAFFSLAVQVRADEACKSCRQEDERQIGDYVEPDIPSPRAKNLDDPRGREIPLPLPGEPIVRHKPGAGVFVGSAGQGNNLFVNGARSKATLGLRRDF